MFGQFKERLAKLKVWANRDTPNPIVLYHSRRVNNAEHKKFSITSNSASSATRKIVVIGNCRHVSHPDEWLNQVTKGEFVKTYLLPLADGKYGILITEMEKEQA